MSTQSNDPFRAYNFKVTVSGINGEFLFTKCSALTGTDDALTFREAGAGHTVQQLPTAVRHEPVTLSYGITESRDLWNWLMNAAAGKVARKTVTIHLQTDSSSPARWELVNAWPQKWQGAELDAASGQTAIASLTLVFEALQRQ